jgi:hypothetical protein
MGLLKAVTAKLLGVVIAGVDVVLAGVRVVLVVVGLVLKVLVVEVKVVVVSGKQTISIRASVGWRLGTRSSC